MVALDGALEVSSETETSLIVADILMDYKVRAAQTPSGIAVHEWRLGPRRIGAPPHRHEHEDEIFYVLEGEVTVMQDDEIATAGPRSYVVLPRGHFHSFWNAGDEEARMLVILGPGRLEAYFEKTSHLFGEGELPNMAEMGRLMQEYGLTMQFERLPEIMARYNLESSVPAPPQ